MWKTGRDIDEQLVCHLYSGSKYDNSDGNNVMHDDHGHSDKATSTSSSVHNDHGQSEETVSKSSGMQDDRDQVQ